MTTAATAITLQEMLANVVARLGAAETGHTRPTEEEVAAFVLGGDPLAIGPVPGRPPSAEERRRLDELVRRVEAGEPAAYVLGFGAFWGREFEVSRDTLVPRRDTEELLKIVLEDVRGRPLPDRPLVLELCCGSGCVAITLARELAGAEVVATDLSADALRVAARNVGRHGVEGRVTLAHGDLFEPAIRASGGRPFDLIVSNPPYIPTSGIAAMGRTVAENEPTMALDGGDDGLDFHRRILSEAHRHLAPGGRVFLEHEHDQGDGALAVGLRQADAYEDVRVVKDSAGKDRALAVRRR
jgi:release factor glutamine methyltransferase